jgi:hypothetical protein
MPKAKKKLKAPDFPPQEDVIVIPVPTEEQKREMEKTVDKLAEIATNCNHRNLHAQPEALCILDPGHEGNHSDGKYAWSDAAGTPPRKHA